MPGSNRVALFLAPALIAVGLTTLFRGGRSTPAQADAPADALLNQGHDPFPVGPTQSMPIFDPRWTNETLFYSLIGGDKVMVEGDLVLGTVTEVLRQSWSNAVKAAKDAAARDELMNAMRAEDRNELRRLAGHQPNELNADDEAILRREVGRAVKALQPLQALRPVGPPAGGVQRHAAAVFAGTSCEFRWPRGQIPYETRGVPHQNLLDAAIHHWETRTGKLIQFVKRDAENAAEYPDYVRFTLGPDDCYAYVYGRKPGTGVHLVTLASGCKTPQIIHEIGHVVGLIHEHCRTDRDKWIQIRTGNMKDFARDQFGIIQWKDIATLTPFDFKSIMLYPYKAFAADPKGPATIALRDVASAGGVQVPADAADFGLDTGEYGGKTVGLSDLDVEGVRRMYRDPPCGP